MVARKKSTARVANPILDHPLSILLFLPIHTMHQAGRVVEALALLEAEQKLVVDGLGWREHRARLLALLGRKEEAEEGVFSVMDGWLATPLPCMRPP